ncbi:long-chain-fatty-acid--CoA ligase 1a isoform X1 [Scyliorhinus canicula]|uniref:long-chain-fatty-acid--CoA ligase 1a isoform X1 n=2 Tax=Scyliorhinus canicula TaxID=7830 RepID=UPI0018F302DF|nr:long-chain-fatty-acid--CoA ligase 1a isoform X1 [Scyliorhinus canicula]XP_038661593.1 long-chain-fatty-acid--CoA ligase 1a isoform X1 [Scyliorhinus canicula]XP_038661594.1 long-chain-fatty-acid--CoA ligase 1a isoform X1 [Scyliorhinus canicula]XP_038661595.1 long-chain-fatty-acid--CoA ligase 1a isoform X1 [Scyliorhinus canicula]
MQASELLTQLRIPEFGEVRRFICSLPPSTLIGIGTIAALVAYWYATRAKAQKPPCDLSKQSVEVEGGERARRSVLLKSDEPMVFYYLDVKTLYDVLKRGLWVSDNGPCLGFRNPDQPYQWLSYREVITRAEFVGSGLFTRGYKPGNDQFIGIFAQNRPEWVIIEQACYTYSMVVVPLYDTLGDEAISYILNKADIAVVFCDTAVKAEAVLLGVEKGQTPDIKTIIIMDPFGAELKNRGKAYGVEIVSLNIIETAGREMKRDPRLPQPSDLAVICFTSGTTGNPKGAMLTHRNIVSNFSAFVKVTEGQWVASPSDIHISFLPLAHMFERLVQIVVLCHGARIGFFQGDIRLLMDDIKVLQPTIFPVVPRLLNRMYDKVHSQANSFLKRQILALATWRKTAELRKGIMRRNSIWDKLVFHKIQESLGGKVRLMVTGAAPVSDTVLTFIRAAVGCQFYEGYGQTECTAGCSMTIPGDWSAGHVGAPMPCNLIKLVDIEEMNYFAREGEGEICIKGSNVFLGYLKDPEKSAEALDQRGWLHTGDVGKWLPNGTLKIIDRKKHIFKLAQGEYIAPEKIENIYVRSEPVAQVFVHGDSLQAFLVGIVIPDPEVLPAWAQRRNIVGSFEELCKNKVLKDAILANLTQIGKESGLKSFEQVKDIYLHPEMLTVQNGLLTPTFKAKRAELKKYFSSQIAELYKNNSV